MLCGVISSNILNVMRHHFLFYSTLVIFMLRNERLLKQLHFNANNIWSFLWNLKSNRQTDKNGLFQVSCVAANTALLACITCPSSVRKSTDPSTKLTPSTIIWLDVIGMSVIKWSFKSIVFLCWWNDPVRNEVFNTGQRLKKLEVQSNDSCAMHFVLKKASSQ